MNNAPLVTIVTPSYNQGHFIRATIESVLSQDYPNIEYIVFDACSNDSTDSIVREYSSRLTYISEKDRGQSDAINKGFHRGKGEILAWINSDDIYVPGAISTAARELSEHPRCGLLYGEGYVMNREGDIQGPFPHSRPFDLWRLVHLSDYILQQSSFYRRSAMDQVGYLQEDLHYCMDWDLFVRIGLRYPVRYIPEYLGAIREYADTKSAAGGLLRAREIHGLLKTQTGMRLPPGSLIYSGETYLNLARAWIDQNIPQSLGFLSRAGHFGLQFAAGLVIGRTLQHSQNLYGDGWAGKHLKYMLHAGEGSILITGSVPGWAKALEGQRLSVYANEVLLGKYPVAVGDFEIQIKIPAELENQPLRLRIDAARCLRPAPLNGDRRRVGYLLNEIGWI